MKGKFKFFCLLYCKSSRPLSNLAFFVEVVFCGAPLKCPLISTRVMVVGSKFGASALTECKSPVLM